MALLSFALISSTLVAIISVKETISTKVDAGNEIQFRSTNDVRVFFMEQKVVDEKCHQMTRFTFAKGLTVGDVAVKCLHTKDEKDDGNTYIVGGVMLSENPESMFIITPDNECRLYFNNNGIIGGPDVVDEKKCKEIKSKLAASHGPVGWIGKTIYWVKHAVNPANWSGSSSSSGGTSSSGSSATKEQKAKKKMEKAEKAEKKEKGKHGKNEKSTSSEVKQQTTGNA